METRRTFVETVIRRKQTLDRIVRRETESDLTTRKVEQELIFRDVRPCKA